MKSIRIYQDCTLQNNTSIQLDKQASNHLLRVLRLKQGQVITLFNGQGGEYQASLEVSGKLATAHIEGYISGIPESPLNIHLYQGISKGDRMDFAIQKSVELGVNQITPVFCERTVVTLKADRLAKKIAQWQSIAISACEQSGRNHIPRVFDAQDVKHAVAQSTSDLKIIMDPRSSTHLKDLKAPNQSLDIIIGPEGGLSDLEILTALNTGYSGIRLGSRILRTETAAIAAMTSAQLLWGDLNK